MPSPQVKLRYTNIFDTTPQLQGAGQVQNRFRHGHEPDGKFEKCGKTLDELKAGKPDEVVEIFFPSGRMRGRSCPLPDFDDVHRRMVEAGRHVNLSALWMEYRRAHPDGYLVESGATPGPEIEK